MKIPNTIYFFLGLALASGAVISQPISPTADVKSALPSNPTTPALDLPYKPAEIVVPADPLNPDGAAVVEPTDDLATQAPSVAEAEKKYTFDNIPFLALKYPAVKALPDPE